MSSIPLKGYPICFCPLENFTIFLGGSHALGPINHGQRGRMLWVVQHGTGVHPCVHQSVQKTGKYTFAVSYREPIWGCWGLSQRIWSNGHWDVTPFLSPGCPPCNEWMKSETKCSFSYSFYFEHKNKSCFKQFTYACKSLLFFFWTSFLFT